MAAGGTGLSGDVEHAGRGVGEAAGHRGERVAAGDPHHVLRLVHSVVANPYITKEGGNMLSSTPGALRVGGGGRGGHMFSHCHEHNASIHDI